MTQTDLGLETPEEENGPTTEQNLQSLSELQRDILFLCAINYEPISQVDLLKCAKLANLRDAGGNAVTQGTMTNALSTLRSKHWLKPGHMFRCRDSKVEQVMYVASRSSKFTELSRTVKAVLPFQYHYYSHNLGSIVREIRLAIYGRDQESLERYYNHAWQNHHQEFVKLNILDRIFNQPFRPEWLRTMPEKLQITVLLQLTGEGINELTNVDPYVNYIKEVLNPKDTRDFGGHLLEILTEVLLLQGRFAEIRNTLEGYAQSVQGMYLKASLDFLQDRNEIALVGFVAAQKAFRKHYASPFPRNLPTLFNMLALLKTNDLNRIRPIEKMVLSQSNNRHPYEECYRHIHAYCLAKNSGASAATEILFSKELRERPDPLAVLTRSLVIRWLFPERLVECKTFLQEKFVAAATNGYKWLAMEYGALLSTLPACKKYSDMVLQHQKDLEITPLVNMVAYEPEWERALKALTALRIGGETVNADRPSRLVWLVDMKLHSIEAREQKQSRNGWSKGKRASLRDLAAGLMKSASAQDITIASLLEYDTYYGMLSEVPFDRAILAMAGHPFVFLRDSPSVSVEITRGVPELIVERKKDEYEVRFSVPAEHPGVHLVKETPTRYRAFEITPEHSRIAAAMGRKTLKVPEMAKDHLLKAVGHLSTAVTVHSEIGGGDESIPLIESDSQCFVHLLPRYGGFRLEIFVRPFGEKGSYFAPGFGGHNIIAEIEGKKIQAKRDLKKERENLQTILDGCPTLASSSDDAPVWQFENPEECLEVLLELDPLRDRVPVVWPEGGKLSVTAPLSFEWLKMRIKKENDWFAVSGELKVDDSQVLEMRRLLQLIDEHKGRFIPIGGDQFLALTESFRKCLDDLNAYSQPGRKDVRLHPLAALTLHEQLDEFKDLKTDLHWKSHVQKISAAESHEPQVPSTLKAELRDYQLDGFRWLSRLAQWGAGACLADDMGLGKTIQALAVILERAPNGPTLVVCPASVTFNWIQEAGRFAPTLNVRTFGGKERAGLLKEVKPFDLFVCSYSLMHNEAELLTQVQWKTIVLDEAQAIKNVFTRRAQAAMELKGDLKIITTGTPIENHLGELWSLFNFINPGLLGSLQSFNARFAVPIEKYKDGVARKRLKRLIQPFVLRRMKSDVLEELPPKTEITLKVDMTQEEAAFYEAMRRRTLENLSKLSGSPGEKHLRILVEIMKLRRACCHMRLIYPDTTSQSSKLAVFEQVINDLLENHHKALVFSQFVDFLKIIRELVESKGIRYQYLDGSTPVKEREKLVTAFQAGEGDLFLISLRAGGQGLNLTAADYVIHMDPWWNPAVEDQASDRAHRIGQQHPVTIYRLVCSQTIEEKIVNLHREKRELAESLLEGGDTTGKITADQLLALIRES